MMLFHCPPWRIAVFLALFLAGADGPSLAAPEHLFIRQGEPLRVRHEGAPWLAARGWLEGTGAGSALFAAAALGPGAFEISARLSLDRLDGTDATLFLDDLEFCFAPADGGRPAVRGGGLDRERPILSGFDRIQAGRPFQITVRRDGTMARIALEGHQVLQIPFHNGPVQTLGFRPGAGTLRLYHFSARGAVRDAVVHIDDVAVPLGPTLTTEAQYAWAEDFSAYRHGDRPDYWMPQEVGREGWIIRYAMGDPAYWHEDVGDNRPYWTLLHTLARDVDVSARVMVADRRRAGALCLAIRWNHPDAMTRAGYDFESDRWMLEESDGEGGFVRLAEAVTPFDIRRWTSLRLMASGTTIRLYVDGRLTVQTDRARRLTRGRMGWMARGVSVYVDDMRYAGDSPIQDGVVALTLPDRLGTFGDGAPDLVPLAGRDRLAFWSRQGEMVWSLSRDEGKSWTAAAPCAPTLALTANILALERGRLLALGRETHPDHPDLVRDIALLSDDQGRGWRRGGLLDETWRPLARQNGRLSVTSTGRVFHVAAETRDGDRAVHVRYSDDGGATWSHSETDLTRDGAAMAFTGGIVVETPDQQSARLFLQTPYHRIYQMDSPDGGATWTAPARPTDIVSPDQPFSLRRDPLSGRYFLFWVYADPSAHPGDPTAPASRLALAMSADLETWQFVMDVDDWQGDPHRFRDLALVGDGRYLYLLYSRREQSPTRPRGETVSGHGEREGESPLWEGQTDGRGERDGADGQRRSGDTPSDQDYKVQLVRMDLDRLAPREVFPPTR